MTDGSISASGPWPRRTDSARVAAAGVTETQRAFERHLDWLYREQKTEDYGIDAHVEVVDGDDVRGRLLAVQIKGGQSWFSESTAGGWWFRPKPVHVQYWMNHSLPVVVVLYSPETDTCYWQLINGRTLQRSNSGGWKVLVPDSQVLDATARQPLHEAADGDPYVLRLRELQLARPWMERLQSGERLVVEMAEWVNKSSGRGTITLAVDRETGDDPEQIATWNVMLPHADYSTVVPRVFAWADVRLHGETYDEADYEQYEAECVRYDREGDRFESEEYAEWKANRFLPELRPYTQDGEIARWRLELLLSEVGKAFLLIDKFANSGNRQITPSD